MERIRPKIEPVRLVSPTGHYCAGCLHFVKDPTPGREAGKCVRFPPAAIMFESRTGGMVNATVSVMIAHPDQEWCGEWESNDPAVNPKFRTVIAN